eukprot:GEMP01076403.1.p1 GENE.GEMP01076403.1~~GEMP01076403.1.p1  ORF type:complete len:104 (+),score=4.93 GEMP01076403.1:63-374(+)
MIISNRPPNFLQNRKLVSLDAHNTKVLMNRRFFFGFAQFRPPPPGGYTEIPCGYTEIPCGDGATLPVKPYLSKTVKPYMLKTMYPYCFFGVTKHRGGAVTLLG